MLHHASENQANRMRKRHQASKSRVQFYKVQKHNLMINFGYLNLWIKIPNKILKIIVSKIIFRFYIFNYIN